MVTARRAERLERLAGELTDALVVPCDLADPDAPGTLVGATLEHFGRVDVVVNNAGMSIVGPAFEDDLDAFRRVVEVNLVARSRSRSSRPGR